MLSSARARASLRNEFKDTKGVPMIQQQQTYFLELYRAGLRAASDIAKASIENAQRLHAQQVDALRQALDTNGDSARRLSEASSLTDLLALQDRKSTRLNSSHANISYAVFCLKKKPPKFL